MGITPSSYFIVCDRLQHTGVRAISIFYGVSISLPDILHGNVLWACLSVSTVNGVSHLWQVPGVTSAARVCIYWPLLASMLDHVPSMITSILVSSHSVLSINYVSGLCIQQLILDPEIKVSPRSSSRLFYCTYFATENARERSKTISRNATSPNVPEIM